MKLAVLWDPGNPMVPVAPVLEALRQEEEAVDLTFGQVMHRTSPNGSFSLRPLVDRIKPDGVLWIEGGPWPSDFQECPVRKTCWLINPHHEPSLADDIAGIFDVRLTTHRAMTESESWRWLPLSASRDSIPARPAAVHLSTHDPAPPSQAAIPVILSQMPSDQPSAPCAVAICPGQGGVPSAELFDWMGSGAVAVVDPFTDYRDLGQPGEHLLVFPSLKELPKFLRGLLEDSEAAKRISSKAPEIVGHLHAPRLRARQLLEAIWTKARILGGQQHRPAISVLTSCYKYLKRFQHYLGSLARQDLEAGSLEVVVADPESPDGLAGYLEEFASRNPHLRVVHFPMDGRYHRNRGVCINRAFDASSGQTIISTDGDIIFPPNLIGRLANMLRSNPSTVIGVRRMFLSRETTQAILDGQEDPAKNFEALANSSGDGEENSYVGVLGYCQALTRGAFAKARYPEEFDRVNQSDIVFNERLERFVGVRPVFLPDQTVLHLWHPRDWTGTKEML